MTDDYNERHRARLGAKNALSRVEKALMAYRRVKPGPLTGDWLTIFVSLEIAKECLERIVAPEAS
jgi:hypothetical protein